MVKKISNYCIIVFKSHNQVTLLHNKLNDKKYEFEIISTPCKISEGCSQSIKLKEDILESVMQIIKESNIKIEKMYNVVKDGINISYEVRGLEDRG